MPEPKVCKQCGKAPLYLKGWGVICTTPECPNFDGEPIGFVEWNKLNKEGK